MSVIPMNTGAYQPLIEEYQYLSSLDTRTLYQEQRLDKLIDTAVRDPIFDGYIQEIELSTISAHDMEEILNQQAKIREYLDVGIGLTSYPHTNIKFTHLANDIVHIQLS